MQCGEVNPSFCPRFGRRLVALCVIAASAACDAPPTEPSAPDPPGAQDPVLYNPFWTPESHEKGPPQYGTVFPQDSVNRLDVEMTAAQWASVEADMVALWGLTFGGGGVGGGASPAADPAYVDVTVRFAGREWRHVGFRLKGHQSLRFSWTKGIQKLPFRLHFDRFEDAYPEIDDQRFHGFRELSMAPGYADRSLLREKLMADIFREAGVPAAATAFYRVYIDFGEGPRYAGLYTAVEVIDDTMVETAFGDDAGNIYKPTSTFQRFEAGRLEKKNHKAAADFSDVQAFVAALNDPMRTEQPEAWRANLEATFDVDHFLRWLAVGTALGNKDAYGSHARNHYLYAHPTRGLVWIPWDHNLSLDGEGGVDGTSLRRADILSLALDEVSDEWPLIRYLMDDPVYRERYRGHVQRFFDGVLSDPALPGRVDALRNRIAPFVTGPDGEQPGFTQLDAPADFDRGVAELKAHLAARRSVVAAYLTGG